MKLSNTTKQKLKTQYGPWAMVTGASSGIGRELAERLAESGLNLALVARSEDKLDSLSKELIRQYGIETLVLPTDLSKAEQTQGLLNSLEEMEIGLVVASVGFGTSGLFVESKLEEELQMLRLNCESLFRLTHHYGQRMSKKGRGGIILMSSMVGFQGTPYAAHYAATKAYVQNLGEALALELKPFGVSVLAAAPGPVLSSFGDKARMQMGNAMQPKDVGVPILKALGKRGTVLPGFLTKFLVGSLRTLPRWGKIRVMRLVMGGMTQHQRSQA